MLDLFENWPKFDIGEGAFYAIFGFLFVFLGIVLLILIFSLIGWINKKINERAKQKKDEQSKNVVLSESTPTVMPRDEEISPEVVAVISAAIAAYYEGNHPKCDFIVKRIKRL